MAELIPSPDNTPPLHMNLKSGSVYDCTIGVNWGGHAFLIYSPEITEQDWLWDGFGSEDDLEDIGFRNLPVAPGVYECSVTFLWIDGYLEGWREPSMDTWHFDVQDCRKVL
jgi:hypothetical protein